MLERYLRGKIVKVLREQLGAKIDGLLDNVRAKEKLLEALNNKGAALDVELQALGIRAEQAENRIREIEEMAVRPSRPIEEYLFESKAVQETLNIARMRAAERWLVGEEVNQSILHGTVAPNRPFVCLIEECFMIVMAGLRTRYETQNRNEKALYELIVGDRRFRPFLVDADTAQVILVTPRILDEEYMFEVRCLEGTGTLTFNLIGLTVSRQHMEPRRPEFRIWENRAVITGETCLICGASIHSAAAVEEAKKLAESTGLQSGVLCCDCYRNTRDRVISEGGGE